jgi:D-beta-D-heptose 7-phosphate kinase/D-beta-D-heptose 1-phosphate adenosyltransferase
MTTEAPDNIRIAEAIRTIFGRKRLLIVGDLMVDRYIWGEVQRISPEAPVPVLRHKREATRPGGAGNVALNAAAMGVNVIISGFAASDNHGHHLLDLLSESKIDIGGVVILEDRPTITKTRFVTGHQHVLRVDEEVLDPIDSRCTAELINWNERMLGQPVDGIILSDYLKGVLQPKVCQSIISLARSRGIPVFIDPKGTDYSRYAGAYALTPNLSELQLVTGVDGRNIDALIEAGRALARDLNIDYVVLTRGADGLTLIGRDTTQHCAAVAREVFDVTGAGDTVIATLAAAQIAGLGWTDMLRAANLAAGIAVGKVGAVAIDQSTLLQSLEGDIQGLTSAASSLAGLQELVSKWRSQGQDVVFTNGCFDILHAGHVSFLQNAAQEGNRLIVAINTDRSVRKLKGEGRPVTAEADRVFTVAGLASVDAVVLFDEDTPLNLIKALRPDVLVKGADYERDDVVGVDEVESWGGRIVLVPLVEGRSTSNLIMKVGG